MIGIFNHYTVRVWSEKDSIWKVRIFDTIEEALSAHAGSLVEQVWHEWTYWGPFRLHYMEERIV